MRNVKHVLAVAVVTTGLAGSLSVLADNKSPIPTMSKDELIKLAMSAAPPNISKDATVMIPGEDGKLTEAKRGGSGFTCMPDIDGQEKPDPICADPAAWQWDQDGKILMKVVPGSKRVKEPPHWMILWRWRSGSRAFRVCRTSSVPT